MLYGEAFLPVKGTASNSGAVLKCLIRKDMHELNCAPHGAFPPLAWKDCGELQNLAVSARARVEKISQIRCRSVNHAAAKFDFEHTVLVT